MKKLQAVVRRLGAMAPRPRTLALDLVLVAGAAATLHGIDLISRPAAWILGGLAAVCVAVLLQRGGDA